MRFKNKPSPSFLDRFHDVRQMINKFNENYLDNYNPSWLSCIDELINSFLDKFCPGFMCVPRKPHPIGNEYHRIADGDEGNPVMYRIKIQEEKDLPKYANDKWVFPSKFERENLNTGRKYTKTSSLMCKIFMAQGNCVNGKWILCDSGNPPLARARCVWAIANQETKLLAEGVPPGTD